MTVSVSLSTLSLAELPILALQISDLCFPIYVQLPCISTLAFLDGYMLSPSGTGSSSLKDLAVLRVLKYFNVFCDSCPVIWF